MGTYAYIASTRPIEGRITKRAKSLLLFPSTSQVCVCEKGNETGDAKPQLPTYIFLLSLPTPTYFSKQLLVCSAPTISQTGGGGGEEGATDAIA